MVMMVMMVMVMMMMVMMTIMMTMMTTTNRGASSDTRLVGVWGLGMADTGRTWRDVVEEEEALAYVLASVTELYTTGLSKVYGFHAQTSAVFAKALEGPEWDAIESQVQAQTTAHLASVFADVPKDTLTHAAPWLHRSYPSHNPSTDAALTRLAFVFSAPPSSPPGALSLPTGENDDDVSSPPTEGVVVEVGGLRWGGGSSLADLFMYLGMASGVHDVASALGVVLWSGGLDRAVSCVDDHGFGLTPRPKSPEGDQTFEYAPHSDLDGGDDEREARIAAALVFQGVGLVLYAAYMSQVLLHYAGPGYTPVPPRLLELYADPAGSLADIRDLESQYVTHVMAASADSIPYPRLSTTVVAALALSQH